MSQGSAKDLRRQMTGSSELPRRLSSEALEKLRKADNPNDEPVYPEAMRCPDCGSIDDIWEDPITVGCDRCGWVDQDDK